MIEDNIIKIILSNTNKTDAEKVITRIKAQLNGNSPCKSAEYSCGLAIYPDDAISTEELIELSDKKSEPLVKAST